MEKVVIPNDSDGCWGWSRGLSHNGYAEFHVGRRETRKQVRGHRWIWEFYNGPIPEGMEIGHRCHDNDPSCIGLGIQCLHRQCTRLDHLYLQTKQENHSTRHTGYRTHCKRCGTELTEENTYANGKYRKCRKCSIKTSHLNQQGKSHWVETMTLIEEDPDNVL